MNVGGLYAWSKDFSDVNRINFHPGEGLLIADHTDTWAAYVSGWQYIYSKDPLEHPINPGDGRPDLRGVGLFARFGVSDQATNPFRFSASGGIGGRGLLPGRDNDVFGVGYTYTDLRVARLVGLTGIREHSQVAEIFYNIAIAPAAHLTLDAQILQSAVPSADHGFVLGMRLELSF